jgi:predicted glycoside hydrolase/deacetylase ChbG (UPF0249 family)
MILCADDYGLSDDINDAILELVDSGRLTAVSCMVALERCSPTCLAQLLKHQSRTDIGLHLGLTSENLPLSVPPTGVAMPPLHPSFGALLRKALLGRVQPREVTSQVASQYEFFVQKCGRRPDFIDGHLHVHQLPGVRQGLLDFVLTLPANSRPYVRNTCISLWELRRRNLPWFKAALIAFYGDRIHAQLHRSRAPTNEGFAGVYDFRNWRKYAQYLPRFVDCLVHRNGILVVHPGKKEDWRRTEFEELLKFAFVSGSLNRFRRE